MHARRQLAHSVILCVLAALIAASLAACSSAKRKPQKTAQPKTIVLDYRNGWFHEADGIQSIESISRQYHRDAPFVAQLNYTGAGAVPPKGKLIYVPPSNDRQYVRAALQRVQGKPELVPTIPWNEDLLKQPLQTASKTTDKPRKNKKQDVEVADAAEVVTAPRSHNNSSLIGGWGRHKTAGGARFMWPVDGEVVTRYREGWNKACHGLEIAAPEGTPVVATRSGTVLLAREFPGYGKMVLIDHHDGYASVYGYNSDLLVQERQRVRAGEKIATVGQPSSGEASQLFFQVRRNAQTIDPMECLD